MNTLPLHPAVVHVPLGLGLVMPVLLGALLWAILTHRLPARAWLVALVLQGVILGAAGLALRTGAQDEERFEARSGEAAIEAHERAAQAFTAAAAATFATVGLALALRTRRRAFLLSAGSAVALSVATLLLGIQAGQRGGALVHAGTGVGVPGEGGDGAEAAQRDSAVQESDEDDDDD